MKYAEGTGHDKLRASKTLGEILETAMSFERAAHEFYTHLQAQVSRPMRDLVRELAEEESRHYALFKELKARPDVHEYITSRIKTPSGDHRFSDYVHLPDLGKRPDEHSILQYAMAREHAAMEQYSALAQDMPEGPVRDLFLYLAEEELAHKAMLEKRYYELVYKGNV